MKMTPSHVSWFFLLTVSVLVLFIFPDATEAEICIEKFRTFKTDHTACSTLNNSKSDVKKGLSETEEASVLDQHNEYRGKENSTNMIQMHYDQEIAMIAQKLAERCQRTHDKFYQRIIPGRMQLGQNICTSTYEEKNFTRCVEKWYNEKVDFKYGEGAISEDKVIGHYTQVVWAQSYKLGCGYAYCDVPKGNIIGHNFVCNYGPGGNVGTNKRPFKHSGSIQNNDCKINGTYGLCDCGGDKECNNNGILDPKTCECQCKALPWFSSTPGTNCTIDCGNIENELMYSLLCFDESYCYQFSNIPAECPKMCKQCKPGTDANWPVLTTTTVAPTLPPTTTTTTVASTTTSTTPTPTTTTAPPSVINPLLEAPKTCKITAGGSEYNGTIAKTKDNIDCQLWNRQSPHSHGFTNSDFESSGGIERVENFCRNPDGEPAPWCYTLDPADRFELCDVPTCKIDCYNAKILGQDYAGTLDKITDGTRCIDWTEQTRKTAQNMPELTFALAKNYCRNPDNDEGGLWCYTSTSHAWGYCSLKAC